MLILIPKTNIDFIGKRYVFFAISALVILSGIVSLIMKGGPKWGLDFTGGTLVEVKFQQPPNLEDIRKALSAKITTFELQSVSGEGTYIVRTNLTGEKAVQPAGGDAHHEGDEGQTITAALQEAFPSQTITILRKEFVGPTVGRHLFTQTAWAFVLTFVGIIIYVAFRFHSGIWGASGVIAIIHDVVATVGVFSILNKEFTVTIIAALLTIAGYSINDTIVVFDFMRERMRLRRSEPLADLLNTSINATLSRTLITNLMVFMVVLSLYFFGGEVIHDFAFAMVFGAIVGTYSSIAIASPIIYEWEKIRSRKK